MSTPEIDNLTDEQKDQVLGFLLYRMDLDTRGELMAHLPMAYVALYPSANHAVRDRVERELGILRPAEEGRS